jgi:inosine-uridine nucleoside N-ribohydrolase
MKPSNITVISDPGVDDLVALLLLDRLTPGVPKTLVSTYGNIRAQDTSTTSRAFVAAMNTDWSYRQGASIPGTGIEPTAWRDGSKGASGVWGVQPKAERVVVETTFIGSPDLIFSLATFTELAITLQITEPDGLCIMAGDLSALGRPELNARMDPFATKQVLENNSAQATRLIDGDICEAVSWDRQKIETIPESSAANCWVKQLLLTGFDVGTYPAGEPFIAYDPLAVYLWFFPEAATWKLSAINVDEVGRTRYASSGPKLQVAVSLIDPDEVADNIFKLLFEED